MFSACEFGWKPVPTFLAGCPLSPIIVSAAVGGSDAADDFE